MAEEAIYHTMCHSRFVNGLQCISGVTSFGRPGSTSAMKASELTCYQLETTCEKNMFTLQDLHDLMTDLCDGDRERLVLCKTHEASVTEEIWSEHCVCRNWRP